MDKQEIFDFTTRKIIEQGGPSVRYDNFCQYRREDGRRCAVGWLISDDDYDKKLEGRRVVELVRNYGVDLRGADSDLDIAFLYSLQTAHDSSISGTKTFFNDWKITLLGVSKLYGLNPKVLEEIPIE